MAKRKVQVFVNADDRYVAIGEDETDMPTFGVATGYRVPMDFRFPACLRFMPDAEPRGDMVELDVAVIDQIYGVIARPRQLPKALTGEDDG